jgi:hypothetical protein
MEKAQPRIETAALIEATKAVIGVVAPDCGLHKLLVALVDRLAEQEDIIWHLRVEICEESRVSIEHVEAIGKLSSFLESAILLAKDRKKLKILSIQKARALVEKIKPDSDPEKKKPPSKDRLRSKISSRQKLNRDAIADLIFENIDKHPREISVLLKSNGYIAKTTYWRDVGVLKFLANELGWNKQ